MTETAKDIAAKRVGRQPPEPAEDESYKHGDELLAPKGTQPPPAAAAESEAYKHGDELLAPASER